MERPDEVKKAGPAKAGCITAHPDALLSKLASGIDTPNSNASEEARFVDYFVNFVWPEASLAFSDFTAGPGQVCFAPSGPNKKADLCVVVPASRPGERHRIAYYNYHGSYYHYRQRHQRWCSNYAGEDDVFTGNWSRVRREEDDLRERKRYAEAMSDERFLVTYDVVTSCHLFHCGGNFARPTTWNPRADDGAVSGFRSLAHLLRERCPDDSLEGLPIVSLPQEKLVREIINDDGRKYGGFVTVYGGSEASGLPGDHVGFCHGKVDVGLDMLGPFTVAQMSDEAARLGIDRDKFIAQKLRSRTQTTVTTGFHNRAETVSVAFLKFLVIERGFRNFTVLHYLHYNERDFIAPFIESMLQKRHELRRQRGGGDPLMSLILKLIPNSFFGYNAIARNKFTRVRIVRESYLRKKSLLRLMPDDCITGIQLVGAVSLEGAGKRPKKRARPPDGSGADLVYAVAYKRPSTKIVNFAQVAASILSNSRVIFFGLINKLLSVFDRRKVALVYCDTDSCYLSLCGCAEKGWPELLLPELRPRADGVLSEIFEDTSSPVQQSGYLKNEGEKNCPYFLSERKLTFPYARRRISLHPRAIGQGLLPWQEDEDHRRRRRRRRRREALGRGQQGRLQGRRQKGARGPGAPALWPGRSKDIGRLQHDHHATHGLRVGGGHAKRVKVAWVSLQLQKADDCGSKSFFLFF